MPARMRTVTMWPSASTTSVGSDSWKRQNQLNGMPHVDALVWTRLRPSWARTSSMRSWCLSRCSSGISSWARGPWMPSIRALAASPARRTSWLGQYSNRSGCGAAAVPDLTASSVAPDGARDNAHQIGPAGGKRIPVGPGDAAQGRQQLGVLHSGAGRLAGAGGLQGLPLLFGERLEGLVDPKRGRERQPGLSVVDAPRHWIT